MSLGISLEFVFPLDGQGQVAFGYFTFLRQAMRDNRYIAAMKKVQEPIIHMANAAPQFVNAIPQ